MTLQERVANRRPDDDDHDTHSVRPYTVTGGRTAVSTTELPMEALVEGLVAPDVRLTPERRRILELTASGYLSVAELSAHLRLPLGVVRILVSDLAADHKVCVHGTGPASSTASPGESAAATLSVLESVLNGISAL